MFTWVCSKLEESTHFSEIEARGTVRIALKKSGLSSESSVMQMQVVVKRMLPDELRRRGIEDGQRICDTISSRLVDQGFSTESDPASPEAVFARLGS